MIFGLMGFEGEGPPKSADSQSFVTSYTITSDESYLDWGYGVNDLDDYSSDEDMFPAVRSCGPDHGSREHETALVPPCSSL